MLIKELQSLALDIQACWMPIRKRSSSASWTTTIWTSPPIPTSMKKTKKTEKETAADETAAEVADEDVDLDFSLDDDLDDFDMDLGDDLAGVDLDDTDNAPDDNE